MADVENPTEGNQEEVSTGAEQPPASNEPLTPQSEGETATPTSTLTGTEGISSLEGVELKEPVNGKDKTPLKMDFILDIPLTVTVEVGRTKLQIEQLLQLGQGSVIELDKLMGEPFEIMVNDKLIARGEIVVVNDRFGVRLTDIVSPTERVESLG